MKKKISKNRRKVNLFSGLGDGANFLSSRGVPNFGQIAMDMNKDKFDISKINLLQTDLKIPLSAGLKFQMFGNSQGFDTFSKLMSMFNQGTSDEPNFLSMNQGIHGGGLNGAIGKSVDATGLLLSGIDNLLKSKRKPLEEVIGLRAYGGPINSYAQGGGMGPLSFMDMGTTAMALAGNAVQQAKTKDISGVLESLKDYGNALFDVSNNDLVMDIWGLRLDFRPVSSRDIRNKTWLGDFANSLSASAQGFSAGAKTGNPWVAAGGAIIGGVSSVVGSLIGRAKSRRDARKVNSARELSMNRWFNAATNATENVDTLNDFNLLQGYTGIQAAYGGPINMKSRRPMSPFGNRFDDGGDIYTTKDSFLPEVTITPNRKDEAKDRILRDIYYDMLLSPITNPDKSIGDIFFGEDGYMSRYIKEKYPIYGRLREALNKKDNYKPKRISRFHDLGGPLFSNGANWDNGIVEIANGGTHEENPYEGIQVGVDLEGTPNLVELGEEIWNDYVFSKRLKPTKDMIKQNKLLGESFADVVKNLKKEWDERPNDPITEKTKELTLAKIAMMQEELRQNMQLNHKGKQYKCGGKLNKFATGGPDDNMYGYTARPIPTDYSDWVNAYNSAINDKGYLTNELLRLHVIDLMDKYKKEGKFKDSIDLNRGNKEAPEIPEFILTNDGKYIKTYDWYLPTSENSRYNDKGEYNFETIMTPEDYWKEYRLQGMMYDDENNIKRETPPVTSLLVTRNNSMAKEFDNFPTEQEVLSTIAPKYNGRTLDTSRRMPVTELPVEEESFEELPLPVTKNTSINNRLLYINNTIEHGLADLLEDPPITTPEEVAETTPTSEKLNTKDKKTMKEIPGKLTYFTNYDDLTKDRKVYSDWGIILNDNGTINWEKTYGPSSEFSRRKNMYIENWDKPWFKPFRDEYLKLLSENNNNIDLSNFTLDDFKRVTSDRKLGYAHRLKNLPSYSNELIKDIVNYALSTFSNETKAATTKKDSSTITKEVVKENDLKDPVETTPKLIPNSFLRYLTPLGPLTGLAMSLPKPSYVNADRIAQSTKGLRDVKFNPIGNYLAYKPFDRNYYINKATAQNAATRRAIMNSTSPSANASLLASDYNYLTGLGDMARQAEEYNLAQRLKAEDFNRSTNIANSEGFLKADMANMRNDELRTNALMASANMREAIRQGRLRSILANTDNLFGELGKIGTDDLNRKMLWNMIIEPGATKSPLEKSKAKGGKIRRRKKGLTF